MQAPQKYISHEFAECAKLAMLFELGNKNIKLASQPERAEVQRIEEAYHAEEMKGNQASSPLLQCLLHHLFQIFLDHWEAAFGAYLDWLLPHGKLDAYFGTLHF